MNITKDVILKIKDEIYAFCDEIDISKFDFVIFCNGSKFCNVSDDWRNPRLGEIKDVNPLDYCEYYPEEFILGIAADGDMYDILNYEYPTLSDKFEEIFSKYGLYLELADYSHAYLENYNNADEDIEYMKYEKEKIVYIYSNDDAPDNDVKDVMNKWMEFSKKVGDIGSCVIGAYMEFVYKGQKYRMFPQSPYQGSLSWETNVDDVKIMLSNIGADEIHFNYGRLD